MKQSKIIIMLGIIGLISYGMLGPIVVSAKDTNQETKTNIGLSIEEGKGIEPPKINPPSNVYEPPVAPSIGTSILPKTGEMIASFIVVLLGISCLIITFGVIFLRKVYLMERLVAY